MITSRIHAAVAAPLLLAACAGAPKSTMPAAETPLIPRSVLFGNPERASVRLSPDGETLAWLAPIDGVMNIHVAPTDDLAAARAITADTGRGIQSYSWTYLDDTIVYTQDKGGDENWRLYSVDVASGTVRDLTPFDGVQARIQGASRDIPGEILVGLNNRNPALHDVHRLDLATGEMSLVEENQGYIGFVADDQYNLRLAATYMPDGSIQYFYRAAGGSGWDPAETIPQEDTLTTNPLGFTRDGSTIYYIDSRGRDLAALFAMNVESGSPRLIAEHPKADAGGVMTDPDTGRVQAVSFTHARTEWQVIDPAIAPDLEALAKVNDGELQVLSRTLDDRQWIVAFTRSDGPTQYYHWDRAAKKARFLFTNRRDLEGLPLAPMRDVVVPARDGLELVSYYTLPPQSLAAPGADRPSEPLPMVLLVHGGPWARDSWGFDPVHQWLANRGYAAMSVNFRGSTGFGKNFANAGDKQWAAAMHDDLLDAVDWAVREGIADRDRVAIMGGSYGGYAALVGLTYTPEVFACGVSIVGPSNLVTLLESIPPYWGPMLQMFKDRVGDPTTEEGRALLQDRSPLNRVESIKRPLLIGQGANDPRVKQAESDQIVAEMQRRGIPVTYVLFPDEGHGFVREENNRAFWAITEAFLGEHLGGRVEPIGDDFEGSSVQVPAGAAGVAGVQAALSAM